MLDPSEDPLAPPTHTAMHAAHSRHRRACIHRHAGHAPHEPRGRAHPPLLTKRVESKATTFERLSR